VGDVEAARSELDAIGALRRGAAPGLVWAVALLYARAGSAKLSHQVARGLVTDWLERWPADFRIRVSYEVRGRELLSDVLYENTGDGPLPCGFGTHAYFRLPLADGSRVADTVVTVPVERFWELEQMIPTGRRLPMRFEHSLVTGLRLDDHQFDTCFTGVRTDADGLVRTRLTDPTSGRAVTQAFDRAFTQCVVYTPGHREAICIEPYTCVPDAIRLAAEGYETGLQILHPGESFVATIRIEVE